MRLLKGYTADDSSAVLPGLVPIKPRSIVRIDYGSVGVPEVVVARDLGCAVEGVCPLMPNPKDNVLRAGGFTNRVAREPPRVNNRLLRRFRSFVRSWLRKHLRPLVYAERTDFETWLGKTHYNAGQRQKLRELRSMINVDSDYELKKNKHKSFTKREFYLEAKWNRWIQGCPPEAKVRFGPVIHDIEKALYAVKSPQGNYYFVKGFDVLERPKSIEKLRKDGHQYQCTDHTAFESHITPKIANVCEVALLKFMMSDYPKVQVDNIVRSMTQLQVCKSKGVLGKTYARMSGDMWTSMANGFTNLMVMAFLATVVNGWPTLEGLVEGDDGLFVMTGPAVTTQQFASLGFDVKSEIHDTPEEAGFCHVHYVPGEFDILVEPIEKVAKLGWTHSTMMWGGPKVMRGLARAKALSELALHPKSPIVSAMARWMIRTTSDVNARFETGRSCYWEKQIFDIVSRGGWLEEAMTAKPTKAARDFVAVKWGVSVDEQLQVERFFDSLGTFRNVKLPILDRHFNRVVPQWADNERRRVFTFRAQ